MTRPATPNACASAARRTFAALFVGVLAAALAVFGPAAPARADVDVATRFGHDGSWVSDAATPCIVTLRNSGAAPVEVALQLRQSGLGGSDALVVERTVTLGPNTVRDERFVLPGPSGFAPSVSLSLETSPRTTVRAGRVTGDRGVLEFGLVDPRQSHGTRPGEERAIGVVGDLGSVIASRISGLEMNESEDDSATRHAARVRTMGVDPSAFRLGPLGLDGLESIVLVDPDATLCADPAELEGLLDWVALGGRLVVSLGENAPLFASSPLAASMPATWGAVGRGDYAAFARFIGVTSPDPFPREGPRVDLLDAAGVERDDDGVEGAEAWIAGRDYGAGRIVLLAFDARGLVQCLPDRPVSVVRGARVIVGLPDARPWKTDGNGWNDTMDLATRIGKILPQDAFSAPPLPAVLLGLFVYVLVVGPGDWLVLKRLRKERMTTFTFAAAVIVFTVVAYGASVFLFSTNAVVNRVVVVQYADGGRPGRELVRFHDVAGYFEPISATRELTHTMPAAFLGRTFPGLPPTGGSGAALPLEIRGNDPLAPKATMEVAFRSQRTIHATGAGPTGRTVDVTQDESGAQRSAVVTSSLTVPLTDSWLLLPSGRFIHTGPVAAGATVRVPSTSAARASIDSLPWAANDAQRPWEDFDSQLDPTRFRSFLVRVVAAPAASSIPPEAYEALRRAGIVQRAPSGRRSLFVAVADESPVPLPGLDDPGRRHVVVAKEVQFE